MDQNVAGLRERKSNPLWWDQLATVPLTWFHSFIHYHHRSFQWLIWRTKLS